MKVIDLYQKRLGSVDEIKGIIYGLRQIQLEQGVIQLLLTFRVIFRL